MKRKSNRKSKESSIPSSALSFPFDFDPTHWEYCAEGAMNIALRYRGNDPLLQGTILRLRKHRMHPKSTKMESENDEEDEEETLEEANNFIETIMVPIIGREFVQPSTVISSLPADFITQLSLRIDDDRPLKRKLTSGLQCQAESGLLMRDYAVIPCNCGENCDSLCIELKPKWGFLSSPEETTMECKTRVNRFTMHQHYTKRDSAYSPMDLFHGGKEGILRALHALVQCPQNNLKLFVNGRYVQDQYETRFTNEFMERIAEVLLEAGVLDAVLRAQTLGPLNDVESVYPLYKEWMHTEKTKPCRAHNARVIPPRGNLPPRNLQEKIAIVQRFMISSTARDCSIMLTFSSCKNPLSHMPLKRHGDVNYIVAVVDLDAKSLNKMEHYYQLDQDIAHAYMNKI